MALSKEEILDGIAAMSVMDVVDLVKMMEDKFGVTAAAPTMAVGPAGPAGPAPVVEEQTEFTVVLTSVDPAKKVNVIKVVRELTGLGLKEAKDLVESAPATVKDGVNKADSAAMKAKLEEGGAKVDLK